MALMLTRNSIMQRMGGFPGAARGLMHRTTNLLHKEMASVRSSEIALSAFTFGVLQGKFKDKGGLTLLALPVDLLAGATFHIFALFSHDYAHHLHAFGDGALSSFFTTTGYRVGERWGRSGSLRTGLSGVFGDTEKLVAGGASIADKELASLVRAGE
jgi:hypothetical protein